MSVFLDASPTLNFLAVGQENVIIQAAAAVDAVLYVAERVDKEMQGMAKDDRFANTAVPLKWKTLTQKRIKILSDDLTGDDDTKKMFRQAVTRIAGLPAEERIKAPKSLGEILLMAHASVFAQQGQDVFILMDESDGRARARAEQKWLRSQKAEGGITIWRTASLLARGEQEGWIVGGLKWAAVYDKMRPFDDGLVSLEDLRKAEQERRRKKAVNGG